MCTGIDVAPVEDLGVWPFVCGCCMVAVEACAAIPFTLKRYSYPPATSTDDEAIKSNTVMYSNEAFEY